MRWELSRQASDDLDEIIRYTDKNFGESQTQDYLTGLYNSFDILAENPKLGRLWADGRHCHIYRSHYIFYRLMEDVVFITNIRNTRQKIPTGWQSL